MPLAADDEKPAGLHAPPRARPSISARIAAARALALGRVLDRRKLAAQPHVEIAAELDVGAAAGHVGGDGHRAGPPGLGDDVGLLLVVAGVQHAVRDLAAS